MGNGQEWAAEPEEIVDYILVRRAASVKDVQAASSYSSFRLELGHFPGAVKCREISVTACLSTVPAQLPTILIDGKVKARIDCFRDNRLTFTWPANNGQVIELYWRE